MKPEKKILVIGLDGATLHLVKKWATDGFLPNLAHIMTEGSFGHLKTVPNQNSAPAWSSFMTGKNPGKHGIYHFYEINEGSYDIRFLNGNDVKSEPVWSILSHAQKKVGVMNVPMTYPAKPVNGYVIAGLDAPGKESEGFTYPECLSAELSSVVPDYVIEPGISSFVANRRYDLAVEMAIKSINARSVAAKYLMKKYPWDFFMVVFRESDVIQHYFWKFMEEGLLADKSFSERTAYADTIQQIYQKLDIEIGRLISELPQDIYIMVLSDHGSAAAEGGPPYINYILNHMGLLKFKDGTGSVKSKLAGKTLNFLQRYTDRKTKEHLLRHFPKLRDKLNSQRCFSGLDWLKTKAFAEPTRMEIWLNLKGREPDGIVSPGDEYDRLCQEIKKLFFRWHDPVTGKKVIKNVYTRAEIYHGEYLNKAPDILILFEDDIKVNGVALVNGNGVIEYVNCPPDIADALTVNGAHRDNGLFMLMGPGIKSGYEFSGARITDLTPTLLYLSGVCIPPDMDGIPLTDLFEEELKDSRNCMQGEHPASVSGPERETTGYGDREAAIIEERLRALGYID